MVIKCLKKNYNYDSSIDVVIFLFIKGLIILVLNFIYLNENMVYSSLYYFKKILKIFLN